jgi:hypothetical protein
MEAITLESCHSTWVFDTDRKRFRRILKHIEVAHEPVSTAWRTYYDLQMDPHSESFTVLLNVEGSRLIRSWRHTGECTQCGENVTTQLSLHDIFTSSGS